MKKNAESLLDSEPEVKVTFFHNSCIVYKATSETHGIDLENEFLPKLSRTIVRNIVVKATAQNK